MIDARDDVTMMGIILGFGLSGLGESNSASIVHQLLGKFPLFSWFRPHHHPDGSFEITCDDDECGLARCCDGDE